MHYTESPKSHWSYSDSFKGNKREYIKSFIHRNYEIGMHTHGFYELNVVLSGRGVHFIDKMSCEAKEGCVFVIPPHVPHGYSNSDSLDVYHMLIHGDFFKECFAEFKRTEEFSMLFEVEPYLRGSYSDNLFPILNAEELDSLKRDISDIDSCIGVANSDDYINAAAKKTLSSLCLIMAKRNGTKKCGDRGRSEVNAIASALSYIHLNYGEELSIEKLAECANMSRSTFIRQFKNICSRTPHKYITDFRIARAKELLDAGEKSATAIAYECGFYDLSHLLKCIANGEESTR